MLNYEYARLVEQDRRRELAARIKLERALHPDEGSAGSDADATQSRARHLTTARSAPNPAR